MHVFVSHRVILRRVDQCKNPAGTLVNVSWKFPGNLLGWICRHSVILYLRYIRENYFELSLFYIIACKILCYFILNNFKKSVRSLGFLFVCYLYAYCIVLSFDITYLFIMTRIF